jgi:hypothetical protein
MVVWLERRGDAIGRRRPELDEPHLGVHTTTLTLLRRGGGKRFLASSLNVDWP